ncbi:MAG: hypothetical protein JNJ77_10270 [Planctomycetia bacterium]|nr:hypothetical protein [Planctomycetia bacterium]
MQRLVCILFAGLFVTSNVFAQDDIEHLSERDWQIPITLTEPIRKEAQSLTLFVSQDQGKTWKKEATAKPSDEFFKYLAPQDGTYWFSVSYVNRTGQTVPAKETDLQPQLKIIVDTKRPVVKVQAQERMNDQITVSWDVQDEHLDLNTLTLQYRAQGDNAWKAVALTPVANGKKQFNTGAMGTVSVRVTSKDKAGNLGEDQTEIQATTMVTSNQVGSGQANASSGNTSPMLPPAPMVPPLGLTTSNTTQNQAAPKVDGTLPPPVSTNNPIPALGSAPALGNLPAPASNAANNNAPTGFKPASTIPQAATNVTAGNNPTGGYSGFQRGNAGPVLWSNSLHLDLDFEVKAGPSGVGILELYYTLDAGKTWQLLDKREDANRPFSVDVPGEGIYGFTMVVKNRAGLGKSAPSSGELPAVRVGVDITAPVCELITPLDTVPGSKDLVNIKWNAIDANLASGPVKIEWAENPTGPWKLVVDKQPNNGVFRWRVPANTPYQVYLKLEVTDVAGNTGQFITREPVLVDLQMPEVKINGLALPKKQ